MPGFLDNDQVKEKLRTRLGIASFAPGTNWDLIVSDSNDAAINAIKGTLLGRGYTDSQIRSWDRVAEFNADIALFWCLVNGGVTENYDDRMINKLDRRSELVNVDVMIDGKLVQPGGGGGTGGGIRSGTLKNDTDLFREPSRRWAGSGGWGCR